MAATGRFEGRAAIVTGASSGIGFAVAEWLGAEGARLVLVASPNDRGDLESAVSRLRGIGCEAEAIAARTWPTRRRPPTPSRLRARYGRLDVLVNNAGFGYYEELLDTPIEHLDRTLAVNVRGTFAMSVEAVRAMAEQRRGAIVNTASTASFVGEEFQVTYNAAKAAVAALTRSMAVDLAPLGIRVNAVGPGWVETRGTLRIIADPSQWSKHRSRIPLDRAASPGEIASVHAFLASDDASYVTGAVYVCDGGLTAGYRFSNWLAVEPPPEGFSIGIPDVPKDLGRPLE